LITHEPAVYVDTQLNKVQGNKERSSE